MSLGILSEEKRSRPDTDHGHCCTSLQSNRDSSNPGGSFTMADSNLFLGPYEILPIAPQNKHLRIFLILS